jgi:hypothetical protein
MGSPAKKFHRKYTFDDYLTWPDDERWEIIDGEAYDMTPEREPRPLPEPGVENAAKLNQYLFLCEFLCVSVALWRMCFLLRFNTGRRSRRTPPGKTPFR